MIVIMNWDRLNKIIVIFIVLLQDLPRVAEGKYENYGQGSFLLGCK
jgi:hypothetical protein